MVGFALHLFALRQQSYAITVRQEHICVCTISTLHTTSDLGSKMDSKAVCWWFFVLCRYGAWTAVCPAWPGGIRSCWGDFFFWNFLSLGWLSCNKTENGLRSGGVSWEKWSWLVKIEWWSIRWRRGRWNTLGQWRLRAFFTDQITFIECSFL